MTQVMDYLFLTDDFLGSGASSNVWKCRHVVTGVEYAGKIIALDWMDQEAFFHHFVNELRIHSRIRHPCITEIHDIILDEHYIYIIMDLCDGGDLGVLAQERNGLDENTAKRIFYDVMSALSYIHRHGIAHRDIKLENILITSDFHAKLTDFGLCRLQPTDQDGMRSVCGTLAYAAPEIITEQPYGLPVDIWSAGVLLYAMVAGHFPWKQGDDLPPDHLAQETSRQIREGYVEIPDHFSYLLGELIHAMLVVQPEARPTAEQILQHQWLMGVEDVVDGFDTTPDAQLVQLVDATVEEIQRRRERNRAGK